MREYPYSFIIPPLYGKVYLARYFSRKMHFAPQATVAQLAVQPIRNRQVMGSNPIGGSHKEPLYGVSFFCLHNCNLRAKKQTGRAAAIFHVKSNRTFDETMRKIKLHPVFRKQDPFAEVRVAIAAVLFTAFIATTTLALLDINRSFMVGLSVIYIASAALTYAGYTIIGSWGALTSSMAILSYLFFANNGIRDTVVAGLLVALVAAGLLAGKTGTLIVGSLIILEIGIYSALESHGRIANQFSAYNTPSDYFTLSLMVGMITVLQWLIIGRLSKSIQNAEAELEKSKKFQQQAREAEARYKDLVEKIPLVIYMCEPGVDGRWHYVSPQIFDLTGYTPQEWMDDPILWYSRVHPDDRGQVLESEELALAEGRMPKLEYRLIARDGKMRWVDDRGILLVNADQQIVQGFIFDVTSRKLAEEQLTKRLAELQAVHGVGETLIRSGTLYKLFFDTGEQIRLAFNANNVLIAIHDPATNLIHFPYDFQDGALQRDVPIRFGEGMTTRIMEAKKPLFIDRDWAEKTAALGAIYTSKTPIKSSLSVPIMTDEQVMGVITLESTQREAAFSEMDTRPILTIAATLAVAIEKTRLQDSIRKEAEIQEKLIRELEAKNEELERFTYTASHDLKSPLITIRGFLGYLEKDARSGNFERLNTDLQRISDAADTMQRLLSELLELSRVGRVASEKQDAPLDAIVAEGLRRVEGQMEARKVQVRVGGGFPVVNVDRERIIEVVQNLVDNAVKFMGSQPEPVIEINFIEQDGRPVFYVRDNGMGIKKEFHKRIFGLFDKLSSETEGTGVGLALVKRIVEVHGGSIWVDSEEGRGATFYFTLG